MLCSGLGGIVRTGEIMTNSTLKTMNGEAVSEDAVETLRTQTRGDLIARGDAGYDQARAIWNALVDKHPGAILGCSGTADVAIAVKWASDNGVVVSVRGGGHNVGGRAICDDGLVIDLSAMRSVHVDPGAQAVRAQGGATLGDVDAETHARGLAVPLGVVSKTGIGGLTTGGGFGWQSRKRGASCDNVLEVEVVTADGAIRTANARENTDLFWGVRGGGGNFGIVTSFLYQAYPLSTVVGGLIAYPRDEAATVLRGYRDYVAKAPVELTVYAALLWGPDGTPLTALVPCWTGEDKAVGEDLIAPLKELGNLLVADVGEMPFPALQSMLDGAYVAGSRNYWKSTYLTGLTDEAIDTIVEQAKGMTNPGSAILIEHCETGSSQPAADAGAFAQRDWDFLVAILPLWSDPTDDTAQIAWARSACDALDPYSAGGTYLNYIGADDEEAVTSAFGGNLSRLKELKNKYDPNNFFRLNANIAP